MKKILLTLFCCLMAFASIQAEDWGWLKVTDASTLQVGDKVVIVAKDYNYAMSKIQNNNNRGQQAITKNGDEVSWVSGVQEFTLEAGTKSGTLAFYTGSGYLYAASSSSNNLKTQTENNDNGSWAISIASDGTATIKAQGTYTRNVMQYYSSSNSSLFACYSSASQKAICIYKYSKKEDTYVEAPKISGDATFVGSYNVEITAEADDIYYSYSENGEFVKYTGAITITENTTIYAKAVNGKNESVLVSKSYTRVAATPIVSFDGDGTFENELVVTITVENAKAYYTLNGKEPNAKSTEYTNPLTIKADATLKVIAIEEGGYKSGIVENKFQLQETESATAETATLVTDVADLAMGDQVIIVATDSKVALSTTQNGNNRGQIIVSRTADKSVVTLKPEVQIITLEKGTKENTFAFNVGNGFLYAASSSANYLKTQTTNNDNGSWNVEISESGVATIKAQGTSTRNWLRYNENSSLFSCYGSGQQDLSIYKVDIASVEDYNLNVSAAGWATLYLGYNVIIPEDVICYIISEIDDMAVKLEEVKGILPANTAVIVNAEAGEYTFVATDNTTEVTSNMTGTLKNEYITKEAYVLSKVDGVIGFYKAEMTGGAWLNNANKAYLPASALPATANSAAFYSIIWGDDDEENTTAIENVETATVNVIYDLSGRRVNEITEKGIYIINGKKVIK